MEVVSVYWWKHNCRLGQYSSAQVHGSLSITLKNDVLPPASMDDYSITLDSLPGLTPEIIPGI